MSHLSTAMRDALASLPISQIELAARSGVSQAQVNKAARGTAPVGHSVIARIISALPAPHNAIILAAYLRDEIPDGLTDLVRIDPNTTTVHERYDPIPADLQGPDRELIGYFARRVGEPTMRSMLSALREAMEAE